MYVCLDLVCNLADTTICMPRVYFQLLTLFLVAVELGSRPDYVVTFLPEFLRSICFRSILSITCSFALGGVGREDQGRKNPFPNLL